MVSIRSVGLALLTTALLACVGSGEGESESAVDALVAAGANDKPWEITSAKGESILPNVFYAEASENEQVMPLTVDGRYAIDRMVYPTIGNPKLYVKEDARDALMVVLRIEEDLLKHLAPDMSKPVPGSPLQILELGRQDAGNALSFSLVPRAARANTVRSDAVPSGAPGVVPLRPTTMLVHPVPADMPEPFKKRRTVRVLFDKTAMQGVPDGLYDLRFEVRRGGGIAEHRGAGNARAYEYQYNAVRVFDRAPANDEYTALNVTDTQASVGALYSRWGTTMLEQFVRSVNTSTNPLVRRASFITFNGDLHNGGSPGGVLQRYVATTYNEEAKVILDNLKELTLPIFLVPGNHDGYASTGAAPGWVVTADSLIFESLREVIEEGKSEWPNFTWDAYARYLKTVESQPGGVHRDVFIGAHVRRENAQTFSAGWLPVAREQRNMVLYDGFHQWQRTYGPLYASFTFGKNRYLNLNTYDLRQHRRTGWGMFIVNYGGGMSQLQLTWMNRELERGSKEAQDVVVLAHHDPRGGHKGTDHGYYYEQLDYEGMGQSIANYVSAQVVTPVVCKLPNWALSHKQQEDCLHDGLADWMRADEEFDCAAADRLPSGTCDVEKFDTRRPPSARRYPLYSGYDFVHKLATHPNVRTLLLGHTHYNSLEVLREGDTIVPDGPALERMNRALATKLAAREVENPIRGHAWQKRTSRGATGDYDPLVLQTDGITKQNDHFFKLLYSACHDFRRVVEGDRRELAVLRFTSNADMTGQRLGGDDANGYSVLHVARKQDARGYGLPQVNRVTFVVNGGSGKFSTTRSIDLDRVTSQTTRDPKNPVGQMFQGGPAK